MTRFFVNIPYPILQDRVDDIIARGLHPEIVLDASSLDQLDRREAQRLAEKLHKEGRDNTLHGPFRDLSPGGVDPKIQAVTRERLGQTMELAGVFRPKCVIFHSGYDPWRFHSHERVWLQNSLETWTPPVKKAEEIDVTLAVENVFETTPVLLSALVDRIASPHFRYCFDVGHHHVFGKQPIDDWIRTMGPHVAEIHLHDNMGTADDHLPIGSGTIDFPRVFRLLRQYLEVEPIFCLEPGREEYLDTIIRAFMQLTREVAWPTAPDSEGMAPKKRPS